MGYEIFSTKITVFEIAEDVTNYATIKRYTYLLNNFEISFFTFNFNNNKIKSFKKLHIIINDKITTKNNYFKDYLCKFTSLKFYSYTNSAKYR